MIFLMILIFAVGALEIRTIAKRRQIREIVLFAFVSALSLSLGYYYFSNPYTESFAQRLLSLLGQEF